MIVQNQFGDTITQENDHRFVTCVADQPETVHPDMTRAKKHVKQFHKDDRLLWRKPEYWRKSKISTDTQRKSEISTDTQLESKDSNRKEKEIISPVSQEVSSEHVSITKAMMIDMKFVSQRKKNMYLWKYDSDFPEIQIDTSHMTTLDQVFECIMWGIWQHAKELGKQEFIDDLKERFNID